MKMESSSRLLGVAIFIFCASDVFCVPAQPPIVAQNQMQNYKDTKESEGRTPPVYQYLPQTVYIVEVTTPEGLANKATDFIYTNSKAPGGGYYTGGIASEILCTSDYSVGCWSNPAPRSVYH